MLHCDASSIVHAWDNYPPDVFPKMWEWLQEQLQSGQLELSQPAFTETGHVSPDCASWLADAPAAIVPIDNAILLRAMALKNSLGIANDDYHAKGVDESDLLIIAAAYCCPAALISNEERQTTLPTNLKKYKIPAVCTRTGQVCMNFLDYLKSAGRAFG